MQSRRERLSRQLRTRSGRKILRPRKGICSRQWTGEFVSCGKNWDWHQAMSKKERRQRAFQTRAVEGNVTAIKMFGEWTRIGVRSLPSPQGESPATHYVKRGSFVLRLPS